MTDQPGFTFATPTRARAWLVTLSTGEVRTVSAHSFRCEAGCLVFVMPVGAAAAYAAGTWATVEQAPE